MYECVCLCVLFNGYLMITNHQARPRPKPSRELHLYQVKKSSICVKYHNQYQNA